MLTSSRQNVGHAADLCRIMICELRRLDFDLTNKGPEQEHVFAAFVNSGRQSDSVKQVHCALCHSFQQHV